MLARVNRLLGLSMLWGLLVLATGARALVRTLVARRAGLPVRAVVLGYGRVLRARVDRHGTEWELRAFPVLVRSDVRAVAVFQMDDAAAPAPVWKRAAVLVSGLLVGFVLASALVFAARVLGGDAEPTMTIAAVERGLPAEAAGVQAGDRILAVDGHAVAKWSEMREHVGSRVGVPTTMTFDRGGRRVEVVLVPLDRGGSGAIGIAPGEARRDVPIGVAARDALVVPWAFGWPGRGDGVAAWGAPGLGAARSERLLTLALALSWIARVQLTPWSFFDGGRVLALAIEWVARRPLPRAVAKAWNFVLIVGVVTLVVLWPKAA
jgi:membrane-associated protease RseP (regulator of RpoE activity)